MTAFIVLLSSLSFGGLAWGMLVVSDWLLRDKPPRVLHQWDSQRVDAQLSIRFDSKPMSKSQSERRNGKGVALRPASLVAQDENHFPRSHRQMG